MSPGKVMLFIGEGYGKSAAALGVAVQQASMGKRVVVIQFLKAKGITDSEFLKRLEPEIKFFRFERSQEDYLDRSAEEKKEAEVNIRNGMNFARKVLTTGECDLLVLDEVVEVVNKGIISVDDLQATVYLCGDTDVIMTGSKMNMDVCTFADMISEIDDVTYSSFVTISGEEPSPEETESDI